MNDAHQRNHRQSIRLKGYDYTTPGAYFVTIVTYHRERLFGEIVSRHAPPGINAGKIKPLGQLIGAFKTVSGKKINLLRSSPGAPVWQRNFYEHIIRSHSELEDISRYIYANPVREGD